MLSWGQATLCWMDNLEGLPEVPPWPSEAFRRLKSKQTNKDQACCLKCLLNSVLFNTVSLTPMASVWVHASSVLHAWYGDL